MSTLLRKPWVRALGAAGALAAANSMSASADPSPAPAKHVLPLSVDGMHQSDLAYYVAAHPGSALARLVASGREFTGARTPFPSD